MSRRSLLEEPVQFITDRFQILARVGEQRHRTIAEAHITQRPIDSGLGPRLSLLVAFVQGPLCAFRQDTLERRQKDHRLKVLLDGLPAQAAEALDLKDVFEPVVVSLVAPTPAVDLIKLGGRVTPLVAGAL